jgi:hypothetical protein
MFRRYFVLGLAPLLFAAEEPAAGVLASVTGTATVMYPRGGATPAHLFDWLKAGASIQTAAGAKVLVVLMNGAKYEVGERSRATLEKGTVHKVSGDLRRLPGLTEIPKLAAIADKLGTTKGGSVGVRNDKLEHCYPSPDAAILPGQNTFSFEPNPIVTAYVIEIGSDAGTVIHRAESSGTPVTAPPGLLQPGATYYWEVRGVASGRDRSLCGGEFTILSAEDETRRASFRAAVQSSSDADGLALLAEIDLRLRLLREAKEEFTEALSKSSTPEAIRTELREIEKVMR